MDKLFRLFGFGLTKVFGQDGDKDANNTNASGGEDKTKTGGGGGGADDKSKSASKDQTHELDVDGEIRRVTTEEMRQLAQKAAGADKRFQEASELRKSAQDGLRLKELVGRLSDSKHNPSETEVRELAGMIGADPEEFAAYLAGDADEDADKGKAKGGVSTEELDKYFTDKFGLPPAEVKQRLDFSHQRHIDDARKEIRRLSDEAVDKDKFFGKMKIGEKADDRISAVKDMVAEDVLRRIQNGEPYGAELVAASVQKIRAYIDKFGIPNTLAQYPITLGLGPSGGLPAEVNSEEPIPRIKATDEKGADNFVARYMQRGLKKIREASRRPGN